MTRKDQRGWWVWGNKPKTSEIQGDAIRLTDNTIGLFPSAEDGAGQAMGKGRIQGRKYGRFLENVIRSTGRKSTTAPPQDIIIIHSYAGGSGSGLILPTIEYCRNAFGPTPYIWVVSVGESVDNEN